MLEAKELSFSYDKEPFIRDVSFEIGKGEFVSVLGANGSGKSTLISLISGALKPGDGSVKHNGREIYRMPRKERARQIACIYQQNDCAFPFTCYETAEMGLYPHKPSPDKDDRMFVLSVMEKTETLRFAEKPITELSGGERQRVLLARALVQRPRLLLLDEAMSGLDIAVRMRMTALLRELTRVEGISVIYVRHDIDAAFADSDRILAVSDGRLRYDGAPGELMNKGFFRDIFNVDVFVSDGHFHIINI